MWRSGALVAVIVDLWGRCGTSDEVYITASQRHTRDRDRRRSRKPHPLKVFYFVS